MWPGFALETCFETRLSGFAASSSEEKSTRLKEFSLVRLSSKLSTMSDGEKKVYVGNLSYGTTDDDLRSHFESIGEIEEGNLPYDNSQFLFTATR